MMGGGDGDGAQNKVGHNSRLPHNLTRHNSISSQGGERVGRIKTPPPGSELSASSPPPAMEHHIYIYISIYIYIYIYLYI